MKEFIFLIFIILIFILIEYDNDVKKIKKRKINKLNNKNNTSLKSQDIIKLEKDDKLLLLPTFRGLIAASYINDKTEDGGSKPWLKYNFDNYNMTNNNINFKKYESYRIRPYTIKN